MPSSEDRRSSMVVAVTVGKQLTQQETARDDRQQPSGERNLLSLERIQPRVSDSRKTSLSHVGRLIESITALGLIEPLVVDKNCRLLAGGHRLAAIQRLSEVAPDVFDRHFPGKMILVRIMGIDSVADPAAALAIEAAENEQRRNYTPVEVKKIADRLIEAGYRYRDGRPKNGEKALGPALQVIIGRCDRTMRRHLEKRSRGKETMTDVRVSGLEEEKSFAAKIRNGLRRGIVHYQAMGADAEELAAALQSVDDLIQNYLTKIDRPASEAEPELDA